MILAKAITKMISKMDYESEVWMKEAFKSQLDAWDFKAYGEDEHQGKSEPIFFKSMDWKPPFVGGRAFADPAPRPWRYTAQRTLIRF